MSKTAELEVTSQLNRVKDILEGSANFTKHQDTLKLAVEVYSVPMEGKRVCPYNAKILCGEVECTTCPIQLIPEIELMFQREGVYDNYLKAALTPLKNFTPLKKRMGDID